MKARFLLFPLVALCAFLLGAHAADVPPASPAAKIKAPPTPHPGVFNRLFRAAHLAHTKDDVVKEKAESKLPNYKHVEISMSIEPSPVQLSAARQMKVIVRLRNRSNKFVQLEFPTSQRIEVIVKDGAGKMVEHWSEDHAFTNEPGIVSINPDERLEYAADVPTREMKAGQAYTVEGFFPNYEALHTSMQLTPKL